MNESSCQASVHFMVVVFVKRVVDTVRSNLNYM